MLIVISTIGKKIFKIKDRRNKAAHTVLLDYPEVKTDKYLVYDNQNDSYIDSVNIHDLLEEVLDIFI